MINDVSRAYFNAPAASDLYAELPDEDKSDEDRANDMIGKLNLSLYGTRQAASSWQKYLTEHLESIGFIAGQFSPCAKPTLFLTNCIQIAEELRKPCKGNHEHIPLLGGRAACAARYPPALCKAVCRA